MQPSGAFIDLVGLPSFTLKPDAQGAMVLASCNKPWCETIGLPKDAVLGRDVTQLPGIRFDKDWTFETLTQLADCEQCAATWTIAGAAKTLVFTAARHDRFASPVYLAVCLPEAAAHPTHLAAKNLTDEMEQFISFAAHDLRTPMRNVESLAELLREDFVDMGDGKLEIIDMLEEVAVKAAQLITEILSQAQGSGPIQADEEVDIALLCDDLMRVLDPTDQHELCVGPAVVIAERAALQIAVRNLIDNALKHSGSEKVAISVDVAQHAPKLLEFSVADNGKGFDDLSIDFLSGGAMTVDSGYGLLGLRKLIRARGGRLSAENLQDGAGGLIRFTLPGVLIAQTS